MNTNKVISASHQQKVAQAFPPVVGAVHEPPFLKYRGYPANRVTPAPH